VKGKEEMEGNEDFDKLNPAEWKDGRKEGRVHSFRLHLSLRGELKYGTNPDLERSENSDSHSQSDL
jgi:hypothetical protein